MYYPALYTTLLHPPGYTCSYTGRTCRTAAQHRRVPRAALRRAHAELTVTDGGVTVAGVPDSGKPVLKAGKPGRPGREAPGSLRYTEVLEKVSRLNHTFVTF